MPKELLARYFYARGLFDQLDFLAMKETRPDELFAAWLTLTDSQRNKMDAEFCEIFELSDEKGFRAIINEYAKKGPRDVSYAEIVIPLVPMAPAPKNYEQER